MKKIIALTTTVKTELSKYVDVTYLVRFLVFFTAIYSFNYVCCALIDPQGLLYSSLLDNHLNYVSFVRKSILYGSDTINHLIGINTYVVLPDTIKAPDGYYVYLWYVCLGLGLTSFWLAFVLAHKQNLKKKIAWAIGGTISLWLINVLRVTMLIIAHVQHWRVNTSIDHHTQFNIVAYALIFLMIRMYVKTSKNSKDETGNLSLGSA